MTYTPSAPAPQAIALARRRFPRLSTNGVQPFPRSQHQPIVASQVDAATVFLAQLVRTKTARVCSYALKHIAEHWHGSYISNGAMITAAIAGGLVVETYPPWWSPNPNVGIGVSRKSLMALQSRRVRA
jgi:hypothetical protein